MDEVFASSEFELSLRRDTAADGGQPEALPGSGSGSPTLPLRPPGEQKPRDCQFGLTNVCCQSRLTYMNAEDIASAIASDDPAVGLRASLALHRLAERVEADHVRSAREKGWSWQQIGDALGVTRQSVHTKYNKDSS
jgi:hypothetical protein